MPLQVDRTRLAVNSIDKLLEITAGTPHGFCDILISNASATDAQVYVYISADSAPTVDDIIVPNVVIPPNMSESVSCMPIKDGEAVWAVTASAEVTIRTTILGKVTAAVTAGS